MSEDAIAVLSNIGSGVVGGLIVLLFNHLLTKRRDLDKEQRARDEAALTTQKAMEAILHLTETEREVLLKCAAGLGFGRGRVWIERADAYGSWIRAGDHQFMNENDTSVQSKYMDAFESLLGRGYFRREGEALYQLTGLGFERARQET